MAMHTVKKAASRPRIVIAENEHARLTALAERALDGASPAAEYLVEELSRAHIVPEASFSPHVARIGSRVTFVDEAARRKHEVTLVYPTAADVDRQRISVLTPVGAALIGMSPAQSIEWPAPDGSTRVLTVLAVHNDAP